jgi:hypothetical protein
MEQEKQDTGNPSSLLRFAHITQTAIEPKVRSSPKIGGCVAENNAKPTNATGC